MKKVATIKTNTRLFFHHWLTIITPTHGLRGTKRKVLGELLYYRHVLSEKVTDKEILEKLTFDYEVRKKICTTLNININLFTTILSRLRKVGIINDTTINPKYIPGIKQGEKEFTLMYKFIIEDESTNKKEINKTIKKNSDKE